MIRSYLKSRSLLFLVMLWSIVIFGAIDIVTPKEKTNIFYGIFVYVFICAIIIGIDAARYGNKMRKLQIIYDHLGTSPVDFGGYDDQSEKYYQDMIHKLLLQADTNMRQLSEDYNDSIEYYSMWVHQIKTPIAALRLMVQTDDRITNKGDYYAEIFRIEQYVEMVLQYMRLKNISDDTVVEKTDVYTLVRESVKKFSSVFISRHLAVDIKFFDQVVYTDGKWLSFMIEQFLSNSLKYSNKGTIHLYGRYEGEDWVLYIRDEGIGIRKEDIPRIFDKGYTGYNGRIYKKSTGIGLYLAKGAADRLNLKISVHSVQNKGTTVKIKFPADILC